MAHYDPTAPIHLHIDASPLGLGAILTQTQKGVIHPVAYASGTLTSNADTPKRRKKPWPSYGDENDSTYIYTPQNLSFTQITNH